MSVHTQGTHRELREVSSFDQWPSLDSRGINLGPQCLQGERSPCAVCPPRFARAPGEHDEGHLLSPVLRAATGHHQEQLPDQEPRGTLTARGSS